MKRLMGLWPLGIVLALGLCMPFFRLHFFHTESAPLGLWRAVPATEPRIGDVVRFCMGPEEARLTAGRPYAGGRRGRPCPHGTWMLAKPVVAVPGDTVVHTPDAVTVNGRALPKSSTRTRDSGGLPIPVAEYGTFVLGDGEFWMHSPYHDGSFDSRYLGVVRTEQLRGTMRPVFTWLTRSQRAALGARGLRGRRCGLVACVQRMAHTNETAVHSPCHSSLFTQFLPKNQNVYSWGGDDSRMRVRGSARPRSTLEWTVADELMTMTEGRLGELARLLATAAQKAIRSGHEMIDKQLLEGMGWVPPAERKQGGGGTAAGK